MEKQIVSEALKANLAQTRNIEVQIPEDHAWFLSLSENYWGIHNRTREFMTELHHPYSNRKEVIAALNTLATSDFWIYREITGRERAIRIVVDIFDNLFQEDLADDLSKQLVYIFLSFSTANHEMISAHRGLSRAIIEVLEKNFEKNRFSFISNLGGFVKSLAGSAAAEETGESAFLFMRRLIASNIEFWEKSTAIEKWYAKNRNRFSRDYTAVIRPLGREFFQAQRETLKSARNWDELVRNVSTFPDIIDAFRNRISEFDKTTEKFCYIIYLIHLPGMLYHRNYLLIDLNKVIKGISSELNEDQIVPSMEELFSLFSDFKQTYTDLVLDSILSLGKEIINTKKTRLIHYFEDHVIRFGFVTPGVAYLTDNWQLKVNPNHVKNIRVWLELIEYNPEMLKKLLSALIINLRLGGIFIYDTDLFQKDVTQLLNSNISPIYKQIKQLTRIFPVYFNEIGAEGTLREVTTSADEISQRNDKLIHFLRKQVHTEGNNSHIRITLEIIRFWYDLDRKRLVNIVPRNVLDTVDVNGPWVRGVHQVLRRACRINRCSLDELLEMDKNGLSERLSKTNHADHNDIRRVGLLIELFQLLKEKYSFETKDIAGILERYPFIEKEKIRRLQACMKNKRHVEALKLTLSLMVKLNQIIFDPAVSEGWESIYYKRHIAFGIPSMYGQYRETKFEALGLTFRLERVASILVTRIIKEMNAEYCTAKTLKEIFSVIELLREGLSLDGIYSQGFDSNLKMYQYSLTSGSFTITQYINIFQFMEASVKEIIAKYFIHPYEKLLRLIIPQHIGTEEKKNPHAIHKIIAMQSETFYRELLSSAFLIQFLDNFIGRTLNSLRKMSSDLSEREIQNIMTYEPDQAISPIYQATPGMDNQVFLGSKAYFQKKLYLNHYPVPPGFVITTEIFRRVNSISKLPPLNNDIDNLIKGHIKKLELLTKKRFANPRNPLLLSVRSGSTISMPGAMSTFLNVGLNDEITALISKKPNFGWTSWDCYRRLLQTWGQSHGMDRNDFDQIMLDYKRKHGIAQKVDFPPAVMKEIAHAYKQILNDHNIFLEPDPFLQLKQAVLSVFHSWNTPRAKFYREHLQIADEWGTAVSVQQMVFGNLHDESGTGVLFTRDVHDNSHGINLTGDFSFLSQGEDIVSGLVKTLPISEKQRSQHYQKSPFSLETAFPRIYSRLKEIALELLEIHGFGHQEIEFTFETAAPEDLYILQTRDMSVMQQSRMRIFNTPKNKMKPVGCGIGIGNDVLNGVMVFDHQDLEILKRKHKKTKAILVRPDTVPDDIEIIFECEGLLTARGGATSHAAVTAATLGKICVVNCEDMVVNEQQKTCTINDNTFAAFDPIAIDGNNGIVYKGNYPIKVKEL